MNRSLFVIILSLILAGCVSRAMDDSNYSINSQTNESSEKIYRAWVKAESYWQGNQIYGHGNTKEEAIADATSRCRERNNDDTLKSVWKKEQFSCNLLSADLNPTYKKKIDKERNLREEQKKILKSNLDDNMEMYKSKCVEIGFALKTKEHANCVLELMKMQSNNQAVSGSSNDLINEMRAQEKRQRDKQTSDEMIGLGQELLKGKSLAEIYGGAVPKSGGGSGSCILTNSVQSGTNRICYYRCGVSTQTSNVGAAQQCPLTM